MIFKNKTLHEQINISSPQTRIKRKINTPDPSTKPQFPRQNPPMNPNFRGPND